ncbi:hypothetical protein PIB30_084932, partial [Stylosanthes scabra]|nr:hypothetical protein [Stylosanthes scabra]
EIQEEMQENLKKLEKKKTRKLEGEKPHLGGNTAMPRRGPRDQNPRLGMVQQTLEKPRSHLSVTTTTKGHA